MDYKKITEKSLDEIMYEIRKELGVVKEDALIENKVTACDDIGLNKDMELEYMLPHMKKLIIGTQIGQNKALMTRKKGIMKLISRFVEKIFLRIAQLITRDIREFNSEVLILFQSVKRKFETTEKNEEQLFVYVDALNKNYDNLFVKLKEIEEQQITLNIRLEEANNKIIGMKEEFDEWSEQYEIAKQNDKALVDEKIKAVQDAVIHNKNLVNNEISNVIDSLNSYNDILISKLDDVNYKENIVNIVEKVNKLELVIRSLNEKVIELNSITKWSNVIEFNSTVDNFKNMNTVLDNSMFYHDFEEKFRGSRNEIKERLKVYLPVLNDLTGKMNEKKYVDLGCGRGEWLDLLVENQVENYVGVDINEIQLNICQEYGHDNLVRTDCIEYIKNLPDFSVDVITGFQVIEHLSFEQLLLLLKECYRVLNNNGIILFETPNVSNIITGTSYFYADPTHEKPLLKDVAKFYVEQSGFTQVQIIETNPAAFSKKLIAPVCIDGNQSIWDENIEILNNLLYGAQDYAIIGVKK